MVLPFSVYAMSITVNPHGLIPEPLVFGMLPRLTDRPGTGPLPQSQRTAMLQSARDECAKWVAQSRIDIDLKKEDPSAADSVYEFGDLTCVARDTAHLDRTLFCSRRG